MQHLANAVFGNVAAPFPACLLLLMPLLLAPRTTMLLPNGATNSTTVQRLSPVPGLHAVLPYPCTPAELFWRFACGPSDVNAVMALMQLRGEEGEEEVVVEEDRREGEEGRGAQGVLGADEEDREEGEGVSLEQRGGKQALQRGAPDLGVGDGRVEGSREGEDGEDVGWAGMAWSEHEEDRGWEGGGPGVGEADDDGGCRLAAGMGAGGAPGAMPNRDEGVGNEGGVGCGNRGEGCGGGGRAGSNSSCGGEGGGGGGRRGVFCVAGTHLWWDPK